MRLSASQISTYLDCRRKWSFVYQDRISTPPSKSAALGTEVHAQLEAYLKGGTLDYTSESGYIAEAAISYLPEPSDVLEIEHEFLLVSPRHSYYGIIDLRNGTEVTDHKTTSDLKWAKTSDDLAYDVQAVLYATTTFVKHPEAGVVTCCWNYITTKKPYKAQPTYAFMTRDRTEQVFARIEDIADKIEQDVGTATLDLPPSPESCEKYGGCPYRHLCNLSPMQRMASIMSNGTTESLIQSLRNKQAINPPAVDSPTARLGTQIHETALKNTTVPAPAAPVQEPAAPPPVEAPRDTVAETPAAKRDTIPAPAPAKEPKTEKKPIDTLYVECFPVGSKKVEVFETFLATAKTMVETEHKVSDYRFLPFGQGPGALAKAFESVIKSAKVSELVMMHMTPEASACYAVVVANATKVVQGV